MDQYQCFKKVQAMKITELEFDTKDNDGVWIHGSSRRENVEEFQIFVDLDWIAKHKPEIGGYLVQYKGGYRSYSPAEAFESGYNFIK